MIVMTFEGDYIKNILWFESDKNYIQPKKTALTLLLPMMFDGINVTMNESGDVWRRVHQKYAMILIRQKLH